MFGAQIKIMWEEQLIDLPIDCIRDRKWASLEWRELDETGSGPVLNARDREFSAFSGKKNLVPKNETGNSDLYYLFGNLALE